MKDENKELIFLPRITDYTDEFLVFVDFMHVIN